MKGLVILVTPTIYRCEASMYHDIYHQGANMISSIYGSNGLNHD